jgi:hypothetical protein
LKASFNDGGNEHRVDRRAPHAIHGAPALRGACPDSDRPRPELVVWQLQDDGQRVQSAEEVAAAAGAERQIVSERQQVEEERIVEQSGPQHATAGDLNGLPGDAAHFRRRAIACQPHFLNPLAIGFENVSRKVLSSTASPFTSTLNS